MDNVRNLSKAVYGVIKEWFAIMLFVARPTCNPSVDFIEQQEDKVHHADNPFARGMAPLCLSFFLFLLSLFLSFLLYFFPHFVLSFFLLFFLFSSFVLSFFLSSFNDFNDVT